MLSERERELLAAVAGRDPSPATPREVAAELGLSVSYAREVAGCLAGRGLIARHHFGNRVDYTITAAGLAALTDLAAPVG